MLKFNRKNVYLINGFLLLLLTLNSLLFIIELCMYSRSILSFDFYPQSIASIVVISYLCYSNVKMKPLSMLISLLYVLSFSLVDIYVSFYSALNANNMPTKYYWPLEYQDTLALVQIIFSSIMVIYFLLTTRETKSFYNRIL